MSGRQTSVNPDNMETLYSSHEELHCSSPAALSERVQSMASGVYNEFEVMMNTYGEGVIKNLMPQIVAILESLNQAYRDKQEHEVELELLRVEHDNLRLQFEREKQLRKTNEQKYLESEDVLEEERKSSRQKAELLESSVRTLQVKMRNTQEVLSRHEEREKDMKEEYSKLHNKYNELFRNHVDFVERTKLQQSESPLRNKVIVASSTLASGDRSDDVSQLSGNTESSDGVAVNSTVDAVTQVNIDIADRQIIEVDSLDNQPCDNNMNGQTDARPVQTQLDNANTVDPAETACILDSNDISTARNTLDAVDSSTESAVQTVGNQEHVKNANWSDTSVYHLEEADCRALDTLSVDILPDDALIEDCFNSPYGVGLRLAEFEDSAALEETKSCSEHEDASTNALHVSLYEELSEQGTSMLGEVDSGADLTVTGMSAAVEHLILENSELLATKNALNIVKDDLIAQLDELSGEVDLLKEDNIRLQRVADEREARVTELETELKKFKEASEKQSRGSDTESQSSFTRVDLMRVLIERNQYKERLMELQEAIRRADMARAAAKESQEVVSKPTKKRSTVWGFFSGLLSSDDDLADSPGDSSKKTAVI